MPGSHMKETYASPGCHVAALCTALLTVAEPAAWPRGTREQWMKSLPVKVLGGCSRK